MRSSSTSPLSSNTHSSTLVALAENSAKLTPRPSQVAPSGKGRPSRIREAWASGVGSGFFGLVMGAPADVFGGAVKRLANTILQTRLPVGAGLVGSPHRREGDLETAKSFAGKPGSYRFVLSSVPCTVQIAYGLS